MFRPTISIVLVDQVSAGSPHCWHLRDCLTGWLVLPVIRRDLLTSIRLLLMKFPKPLHGTVCRCYQGSAAHREKSEPCDKCINSVTGNGSHDPCICSHNFLHSYLSHVTVLFVFACVTYPISSRCGTSGSVR